MTIPSPLTIRLQATMLRRHNFVNALQITCRHLHNSGARVNNLVKNGDIEQAKTLYFTHPDPMGATILISRAQSVHSAQEYYNALVTNKNPNAHVFNALINVYKKAGHDITSVWNEIITHRVKITAQTYVSLLSYCGDARNRNVGNQVHTHMTQNSGQEIYTNHYVHNTSIKFFVKTAQIERSTQVFRSMGDFGLSPDNISYTLLMDGYAMTSDLNSGEQLYNAYYKSQLTPNVIFLTAAAKMYASCGMLDKSLSILTDMINNGPHPNEYTFVVMLSACSTAQNWIVGEKVSEVVGRTHCLH